MPSGVAGDGLGLGGWRGFQAFPRVVQPALTDRGQHLAALPQRQGLLQGLTTAFEGDDDRGQFFPGLLVAGGLAAADRIAHVGIIDAPGTAWRAGGWFGVPGQGAPMGRLALSSRPIRGCDR